MSLTIVGKHPLQGDAEGRLISTIATIFPHRRVLVTQRGIHAQQRLLFSDFLNHQRQDAHQPPLTEEEETREWAQSVDLIIEPAQEDAGGNKTPATVLIRPDPDDMGLAFDADEILQELVPKIQIRFLNVFKEKVRQAIKARGECWRISPLPRSAAEIVAMIRASRVAINQLPLYYYNKITGTRFLTCDAFAQLQGLRLAPEALALQLQEIRTYLGHPNRLGNPEIALFQAEPGFSAREFSVWDFLPLAPDALDAVYQELRRKFTLAVPPELRLDNPNLLPWRQQMLLRLIEQEDETHSEEVLQGLSPEFFLQIEWLPGGRIEDGELIFDSVFDTPARPGTPGSDPKGKNFIFNFIREFGMVEYINFGRLTSSLSQRTPSSGRREVYLGEIKLQGQVHPIVRVIRMQKWDVLDHLEEGKTLLQAILEAEDYTEYILDRRLGCRQLGMNLPHQITVRKLNEPYSGSRLEYAGLNVWSTYFERDYVSGVATDKIVPARFENPAFALRFAHLLGKAAAVNIIAGRADITFPRGASTPTIKVLFDDGDEVVQEDAQALPREIIITDHTGSFAEYELPLAQFTSDYAQPINRRARFVPDPAEFASVYLAAFVHAFVHIQGDYRKRRQGFDGLFRHCKRDIKGSFAYRWERVLQRLDQTDAQTLADQIRACLQLPSA